MSPTSWSDIHLELDIHRHFDAARAAVYKAFIDEDQIAAWSGPTGCWVPRDTVSIDAKVGGHRRFTVITGEGLPNVTADMTFSEVIPDRLLVGHEDVSGFPGVEGTIRFSLRLEFVDEGSGTRLELIEGPCTIETEATAREAWLQGFTKLDAFLAR